MCIFSIYKNIKLDWPVKLLSVVTRRSAFTVIRSRRKPYLSPVSVVKPVPSRLLSVTPVKMSDSEEDPSVPDAATAQKLVKEFEAVTNTDEIMAQMYLQVIFTDTRST